MLPDLAERSNRTEGRYVSKAAVGRISEEHTISGMRVRCQARCQPDGWHHSAVTKEVERASERLAIYEALDRALADPHALLDLLISAENPEVAAAALQQRFGLDEMQAAAVLDLQFRRVTVQARARIVGLRKEEADYLTSLGDAGE